MASLVRLRVVVWALQALLSVAASDLLRPQPAFSVSNEVLAVLMLGLMAIKFLCQFFFFNATGEESG